MQMLVEFRELDFFGCLELQSFRVLGFGCFGLGQDLRV